MPRYYAADAEIRLSISDLAASTSTKAHGKAGEDSKRNIAKAEVALAAGEILSEEVIPCLGDDGHLHLLGPEKNMPFFLVKVGVPRARKFILTTTLTPLTKDLDENNELGESPSSEGTSSLSSVPSLESSLSTLNSTPPHSPTATIVEPRTTPQNRKRKNEKDGEPFRSTKRMSIKSRTAALLDKLRPSVDIPQQMPVDLSLSSTFATSAVHRALTLSIRLDPKKTFKRLRNQSTAQDLKFDVFFNGQLESSTYLNGRYSYDTKYLSQFWSGRRIERTMQSAWLLSNQATNEKEVKNFPNSARKATEERWTAIGKAIQQEAELYGFNADHQRPPVGEYLTCLASMDMPDAVVGIQKLHGPKFGVVDVVVSLGEGSKKWSNQAMYVDAPHRLKDSRFVVEKVAPVEGASTLPLSESKSPLKTGSSSDLNKTPNSAQILVPAIPKTKRKKDAINASPYAQRGSVTVSPSSVSLSTKHTTSIVRPQRQGPRVNNRAGANAQTPRRTRFARTSGSELCAQRLDAPSNTAANIQVKQTSTFGFLGAARDSEIPSHEGAFLDNWPCGHAEVMATPATAPSDSFLLGATSAVLGSASTIKPDGHYRHFFPTSVSSNEPSDLHSGTRSWQEDTQKTPSRAHGLVIGTNNFFCDSSDALSGDPTNLASSSPQVGCDQRFPEAQKLCMADIPYPTFITSLPFNESPPQFRRPTWTESSTQLPMQLQLQPQYTHIPPFPHNPYQAENLEQFQTLPFPSQAYFNPSHFPPPTYAPVQLSSQSLASADDAPLTGHVIRRVVLTLGKTRTVRNLTLSSAVTIKGGTVNRINQSHTALGYHSRRMPQSTLQQQIPPRLDRTRLSLLQKMARRPLQHLDTSAWENVAAANTSTILIEEPAVYGLKHTTGKSAGKAVAPVMSQSEAAFGRRQPTVLKLSCLPKLKTTTSGLRLRVGKSHLDGAGDDDGIISEASRGEVGEPDEEFTLTGTVKSRTPRKKRGTAKDPTPKQERGAYQQNTDPSRASKVLLPELSANCAITYETEEDCQKAMLTASRQIRAERTGEFKETEVLLGVRFLVGVGAGW